MRSSVIIALLSTLAVFGAPIAERADGGNAYSGAAGQAIGGTNTEMSQNGSEGLGDNVKALNMFSDNAGNGGKAKSGDAFGGQGTVSYVWSNGAWVPSGGKGGDAYTGVGGIANGGNKGEYHYAKRCPYGRCTGYGYGWKGEGIAENLKLGNIASNNAGDGGDASSGTAVGGNAGGVYGAGVGYAGH